MEKKAMAAVIINLGSKICRAAGSARRYQAGCADTASWGTAIPGSRMGKDLVEQSSRHLWLVAQVFRPGQALTGLLEHLRAERTFAGVPGKGGRVARAQGFVQRIGDQSFPFVVA
jgi:hypothetical protein